MLELKDNSKHLEYHNFDIYLVPVKIFNLEEFFEFTKKLEEPILLQLIPCEYVLDIRQIFLAVMLAIDAWLTKRNISRKLNLEILLRLLKTSQIREAIKLFNDYKGQNYWLIIIIDKKACKSSCESNPEDHLVKTLDTLKNHLTLIQESSCTPNADVLRKIYGLNETKINAQRDHRKKDVFLDYILEKINITYL